MKKIVFLFIILFAIDIAIAANYYEDDPNDCPTSYLSQGPVSGKVVCGETGGTVYLYDPASLTPPATTEMSNAGELDHATFSGGYIIDCYSYDGGEPHCDDSGTFLCNQNDSCYDSPIYRQTNCTGGSWAISVCGNCRWNCSISFSFTSDIPIS